MSRICGVNYTVFRPKVREIMNFDLLFIIEKSIENISLSTFMSYFLCIFVIYVRDTLLATFSVMFFCHFMFCSAS